MSRERETGSRSLHRKIKLSEQWDRRTAYDSLVELVEDRPRRKQVLRGAEGLLHRPQLLVAEHGLERIEISVGAQHEDAVEFLLLLDLVGIDREVLVADRLQVAPKAGVADEGLVALGKLALQRGYNKHELLMVLDRPEIPLRTNGSENDIRCQVTKRKVSGGTRSDTGRDCRDAFLGLSKICAKLGFAFWDYLGSRLAVPNQPEVPYLPAIVRHRCATA